MQLNDHYRRYVTANSRPGLVSNVIRSGGCATLGVMISLLIAGCSVGPNYQSPQTQMPDRWHESLSKGLVEGRADLQTWWAVFNDPTLTSLIERANSGNLQLKEAVARIEQARLERGIAAGGLYPTLSGNASYSRARVSGNGLQAPPDRPSRAQQFGYSAGTGLAAQAIAGATNVSLPVTNAGLGLIPSPTHGIGPNETNLSIAGFDSAWEIDLFGGIRRSVESADANLQATVEQYRDMLVTLLAEVALNYSEVRTLQARLAYAQENVGRQRQTLELVENRFKNQLVSRLDVVQAKSNLSNSESEIPLLDAELVQAINRLGILLGQPPAALHENLSKRGPIPIPPGSVAIGLPADLLRQRPDVRQAERVLAAMTAQIGVATADLYPRFTLSGTFALEGIQVKNLGNLDSGAWSFGPAMRWNIFDGVRNIYRVQAARFMTEQARLRYEQTVLTALQDVENAMVAYEREQLRRDSLALAAKASGEAVDLVRNQYANGLTDFQNVLDTERSLFQQQDQLAVSEGQVAKILIALYKALGGGWSLDSPATQAAPVSDRAEDRVMPPPASQPVGG